jgi:hypothetical protein
VTFNLWCRYPYSPRICVKLQRLALERTLSETTSFMTSFSSSKLYPLRICFLFSYVASSPQTVGVIYKTERDSFRVLDQNGQTRLVKPHQISMRRDSVRAVANDAEGHELRIHDNVKEADGLVRSLFPPPPRLCTSEQYLVHRDEKDASFTFTSHFTLSCITETSQRTAVSLSPGPVL